MHPVLFTLPLPWGPQPVYSYGLLLGLSLILGFQLVARLGDRHGLDSDLVGGAYLATALGGLVGARLLYVATNLDDLARTAQRWFDLGAGGLSAYGALFGGGLVGALYLRLKRAAWLDYADVGAPIAALGLSVTRIGCYLHGADFGARLPEGAPAWLAALGRFPRWNLDEIGLDGAPAFWFHVERFGLARDADYSFPVHPAQLYELVALLVLAGLALAALRHKRFSGQAALATAFGYAALRLLLEPLRGDPERGELLGFSGAQLLSMFVLPASAIAYSVLRSFTRAQRHRVGLGGPPG